MVRRQFEAYPDKVFGFADLVAGMPEGRTYPPVGKVVDAVFLGTACQFATLPLVAPATIRVLAYTSTTVFYHRRIRSHCRKRAPGFCEMARLPALSLFADAADTS